MAETKFIHHSSQLRKYHTNSEFFDNASECSLYNNGSSSSGSSISSTESSHADDLSSSSSEILETIRLVRESAITTNRNDEGVMEVQDEDNSLMFCQEEIRPANQNSDSESSTSHPSVHHHNTTRRLCENNIKNVLEGKQVRFPTTQINADDDTRIEDGRGTLNSMTRHFADGVDFTPEDNCLLDLYQLMQSSNAPILGTRAFANYKNRNT